jgi:hypothetical protein
MTRKSGQPDSGLMQVSNLREFFRDSIGNSMASNQLIADRNTAYYVVNLLTLFARAEDFHDPTDDTEARKPLALMLADALDAPTAEQRCFGLQRLGDISLFIAGFFAHDLQHSAVDMDYYVSMGGGAYCSLSQETRGTFRGKTFGKVYAELGDNFQKFVDVLNDIRDQAGVTSDIDVLRQYEIWLKTGSDRAARLLQRQGIYPLELARSTRQH